jgi:Secretion system C-terminal sorting domain
MRKIYLLTLLMSFFALGQAQTFTVHPANTVNTNVDVNHSVDVYIHFANAFQSQQTLVWETTNLSVPNQWFMTVCDNGSCFTLPHLTDTMVPVLPGDTSFLKVTCVPNGQVATGVVSFRVYDLNSPTSSANVTFNFNSTNITAVSVAQLDQRYTVSPNPATEILHLSARGSLLDKGTVTLMDLQGHQVLTQDVNAVLNADLRVGDLAPGIYMLRYATKVGTVTKKVVIAR